MIEFDIDHGFTFIKRKSIFSLKQLSEVHLMSLAPIEV